MAFTRALVLCALLALPCPTVLALEDACPAGPAVEDEGKVDLLQKAVEIGSYHPDAGGRVHSEPGVASPLDGALGVLYQRTLLGFAVSDDDKEYGDCPQEDVQNDAWWQSLLSRPGLRQQWAEELAAQEDAKKLLAEVGAEELAAEEDGVEVEELLADDTGAEGDAETRASAMKMMVPMMRKKKKMMMTMMMMGNLLAEVGAEELAGESDAAEAEECCVPSSYAEVTPEGVEQLAAVLGVSAQGPAASFLDLGSGVGRLAMHMMLSGFATAATGIELDPGRHRESVQLARQLFSPQGASPRLLQGDMLDASGVNATALYMNLQCFRSAETRQALVRKILGGDFGQLQVIVANPELEELEEAGSFQADKDYLELPMMHMDNMVFRVYRKV